VPLAETQITVVQTQPSAERLKGLEAWRLGGLEAWRLGGLEAWRLGGLEAWRLGSIFYQAPQVALSELLL
jgi:hypothetical protein